MKNKEVTFGACSEESLRAQYEEYVKREISPGEEVRPLDIREQIFSNNSEATLWLNYHCNKFGSALAVKVGDFSKQFPAKLKDKKIVDKYNHVERQLKNWNAMILKNAQNGTKKQVTCSKCESKISISYMSANECPVCKDHDILHSKGEMSKLKKLQASLDSLKVELEQAKEVYENSNKKRVVPFWLVMAADFKKTNI